MKRTITTWHIISRELEREYAGLVEGRIPWKIGYLTGGRRCEMPAKRTGLRCRRAAMVNSTACAAHASMLGKMVYKQDRELLVQAMKSYLEDEDAT